MKMLNKLQNFTVTALLAIALGSCSTYSTDLNEMETINIQMDQIKKGQACSYNAFGGFSLPWIGDTSIKVNGDESVISAMKRGDISSVYAIDKSKFHIIVYSKRCTIVFGK